VSDCSCLETQVQFVRVCVLFVCFLVKTFQLISFFSAKQNIILAESLFVGSFQNAKRIGEGIFFDVNTRKMEKQIWEAGEDVVGFGGHLFSLCFSSIDLLFVFTEIAAIEDEEREL
jgi:hypothetical protein